MSLERTACMHRGATFQGQFEVIGAGEEQTVRVRYHGAELEEPSRGRLPEVTAHHLLKELVVLEAVQIKVQAMERSTVVAGSA